MSAPEGFVQLTPRVVFSVACPGCKKPVDADDWQLPGMWLLGKFHCGSCSREFFHDLPYALGVLTPCYLDAKTSAATPEFSGKWYADLTASAWKNRSDKNVQVTVERSNHGKKVCLVNCLYPWWGDAAGLLLRVNQLKGGMDVIVLINPALRWLVPDDVGGVWVVDQELDANSSWNEALDTAIKAQIEKSGLEIFAPRTFQPAYLTQDELQAACKIKPFPRDEWNSRLQEKPVVTFMWRDDRSWSHSPFGKLLRGSDTKRQAANVASLANELRKRFPKMEFSVCGIGKTAHLPEWIKDMRVAAIGAGDNEAWAAQGASSHVLCGVTGSHLTIPGSLAGTYVELVPPQFWSNIMTCASVTTREPRETLFCNRFLPVATSPADLADIISAILLNYSYAAIAFKDAYYTPLPAESLEAVRSAAEARRRALEGIGDGVDHLSN